MPAPPSSPLAIPPASAAASPPAPLPPDLAAGKYRAFATDFDGTIAHDGAVPDETLAGLRRLRRAGWKVILVTGREIADLQRVFPPLDIFDVIVGENGALLYWPQDAFFQRLCEAPPPHFVERLVARGVGPISIGHAIVATWEPHQAAVLETIKELGLDLQVIFNKGAVMILPQSVNKGSGLQAVLDHFKILPAEVVAVGDAENDLAMFALSGLPVAVGNALPSVKESARLVTVQSHGAGAAELIDLLLGPARA